MQKRTITTILRILAPCCFALMASAALATQEVPVLSINIPTISLTNIVVVNEATEVGGVKTVDIPWIAQYVTGVYSYAVAIAGMVAGAMFVIGGFQYLTAGGDASRVTAAKERIKDALIGLLLVLGAFFILTTINPTLVSNPDLRISTVKRMQFQVSPGEPVPSGTTVPGTGQDGIPYFAQCDPRWGQTKPGDPTWPASYAEGRSDCTTICRRGCGTTSLAMVLSHYGQSVDPLATARWGLGCTGGYSPTGTLSTLANSFGGLRGDAIWGKNDRSYGRITDALGRHEPIVYNCAPCNGTTTTGTTKTYPGHYIVLTGYDPATRTFRVNDPGSSRGIVTMSYDQFTSGFVYAIYVHR